MESGVLRLRAISLGNTQSKRKFGALTGSAANIPLPELHLFLATRPLILYPTSKTCQETARTKPTWKLSSKLTKPHCYNHYREKSQSAGYVNNKKGQIRQGKPQTLISSDAGWVEQCGIYHKCFSNYIFAGRFC